MTAFPVEILIAAVRAAGDAIADFRRQGNVTVTVKDNKDVLTQADLLANQILKSRLQETFPQYGWLSEESVDDQDRLQCERVWIVDPIDGTREFIAGVPEYAISAALVENGVPVLACVFNPETDELFSAVRGEGAYLNGSLVRCRQSFSSPLTLLASRSEYKRGEWDRFQQHDVKPVGSIAYKLGLVAAGKADATFSLGPKSEWDIAAGTLLVTEAGGMVTDKYRQEFVFNQSKIRVSSIVAVSSPAAEAVFRMIAAS